MAQKKKNPVPNKDLYWEIVKSKQQGELTPEAQRMLLLLAQRAQHKMSYISEQDRDDCLQAAYIRLMKYWKNFNTDYSNAFAYYTEIAKKGFAEGWNHIRPSRYSNTISIDSITNNEEGEDSMFNL